jgi:hypothetical protein
MAPRTVLKRALENYSSKTSLITSAAIKELTFQLSRITLEGKPPLAEQLSSNNQGVLMGDNIHFDMIN